MSTWMRPAIGTLDPWHLEIGVSPGGLRVAHCGVTYRSDELLITRMSDDAPDASELCEACHVAFRRLPREFDSGSN